MRRLICTFIVRIRYKTGFLMTRLNLQWNLQINTCKYSEVMKRVCSYFTPPSKGFTNTKLLEIILKYCIKDINTILGGSKMVFLIPFIVESLNIWIKKLSFCDFCPFLLQLNLFPRIPICNIGATSWENLFCHKRTTKAQISLCIRAVWSAPLLFTT